MDKATGLACQAWRLRRSIIDMIYRAGSGHSGGSLSCAEILTVLYDSVLNLRPQEPRWPDRDRFVLSKGHAAPALYAVLAEKGFFPAAQCLTLRQYGSPLEGHPCMFKLNGVDMSTGSLGMGFSVGVGMALAAKQLKKSYKVYVLCGDGEMQEGQNWEAAASAAKWQLDNLTVIIDHNRVQLDDQVANIMPTGDLKQRFASFGLGVLTCDGHDTGALLDAFAAADARDGATVILAETVKGKGVSFMEGQSAWHGAKINEPDYIAAMGELDAIERELRGACLC